MRVPLLKIRGSWDHLIFNMGLPILVRQHLYIETPPRFGAKPLFTPTLDCSKETCSVIFKSKHNHNQKMNLNMSSAKRRTFCLHLNVFIECLKFMSLLVQNINMVICCIAKHFAIKPWGKSHDWYFMIKSHCIWILKCKIISQADHQK